MLLPQYLFARSTLLPDAYSKKWNLLPASVLPESYNLQLFKTIANRDLPNKRVNRRFTSEEGKGGEPNKAKSSSILYKKIFF